LGEGRGERGEGRGERGEERRRGEKNLTSSLASSDCPGDLGPDRIFNSANGNERQIFVQFSVFRSLKNVRIYTRMSRKKKRWRP
jgi:hypothetical protein